MKSVPLFASRDHCRNIVSIQINIPPMNWEKEKIYQMPAYSSLHYYPVSYTPIYFRSNQIAGGLYTKTLSGIFDLS